MSPDTYDTIEGRSPGFVITQLVLFALVALGGFAAHQMDTHGHYITGMSNQIVWGLPHVFAIFLIVAASGALNVASMASVFGREVYRPLARLSAMASIALLCGGLAILVLDLGRPDRLVVALTYFNFKSVFAWNIFLYIGFIVVVTLYLWMLMEGRFNRYAGRVGVVALLWRIVLTTGTGCIFAFLVARESYYGFILAPLLIALSLSYGLAVFVLITMMLPGRVAGEVRERFRRLLGIFGAVALCLVALRQLISFYTPGAVEWFLLLDGGVYSVLFWVGQMTVGTFVPVLIGFHPKFAGCPCALVTAAAGVVVGGVCQLYILIIGGQAYPMPLLAGYEIVESAFFDGVVATYIPSGWELALGLGGLGLAGLLLSIGIKAFRCMPAFVSE